MSKSIAWGLDGGASSLKWTIRDANGTLRHGQTLGANPQVLGWQRFFERLTEAARLALEQARAKPNAVGSVGLGLSGVDRPDDENRVRAWLLKAFPALHGLWVGNDAWPALRLGAGRLEGIILIAGTGSIGLGALANGRMARVGGWGDVLGDEGSGFWIGRQALAAACQMADGRRRPTRLLGALLNTLHLTEPMGLIPWLAAQDADQRKRNLAGLASDVAGLARQGDPVAQSILRQAGAQLARHIFAIRRQLGIKSEVRESQSLKVPKSQSQESGNWTSGLSPHTVVCTGGLFEHVPQIREDLTRRLSAREPNLKLIYLQEPASLGALFLGEEHAAPKREVRSQENG